MLFTFWEGKQPDYIKLCLETWQVPYTLLNYDNLNQYTDLNIDSLKKYTLPQIADVVRVHVLRDNGGYWLDSDTIMLADKLPAYTILGDPDKRTNTIGMLHTEAGSDMFVKWAECQDNIISTGFRSAYWGLMGNCFTDQYLKDHTEIDIGSIKPYWPEAYMILGDTDRRLKYIEFYFNRGYKLSDISKTGMIMLHNSWTPGWYKKATRKQILEQSCNTLSNILKEVVK